MIPEEIQRRCIQLCFFVGYTVSDTFAGIDTILRVAKELGQNSIGYELNPEYEVLIRMKLGVDDRKTTDTFEFIRTQS